MDEKPPLEPSLRALADKDRRKLDDHPTPEELVAYRAGELTREDEERIQDHLALCPDCTQMLLDLEHFEQARPSEEGARLSDADVEAAWRRLRPRLEEREALPAKMAPVPPVTPPRQSRRSERETPRRQPRAAWSLAAALFLCTVGLAFWGMGLQRQLTEPEINLPLVELQPVEEGTRGGSAPADEGPIPAGHRSFVAILHPLDPGNYPDYEIEIVPAGGGGEAVWKKRGLERKDEGMIAQIPLGPLSAGTYRIRLFGLDGNRRAPLGEFEFEIAPEDG